MSTEIQPNQPKSAGQSFLEEYLESMIVYEDNCILAINKPSGVSVYGVSKTCPFGIAEAVAASQRADTHAVHRIDRDTSGLLLLGKSGSVRRSLSKQFSRRSIRKIYLALVDGQWDPALAGIIAPLTRHEPVRVELSEHAKRAATAFRLIAGLEDEQNNPYSLLEVHIFTGKTHQIRAHSKELDHPIVGDKIYNSDPIGFPRHLLHAWELTFIHPETKQPLTLHAPLEPDFGQIIIDLRINNATDTYRKILHETQAIRHSILLSDRGA